MEDKELVLDREHHILYTKQCREEILNKISLHYSAEDVEKIFTKVQLQYVGFLKDYRRMNVAITRAKEQLIVIGDSATIGADKFFNEFLSYVEKFGNYRTVWEFEV